MSLPVEKRTYINSDDKTCRSLTYDLFSSIHESMEDIKKCHVGQIESCNERFNNIENSKKKDTLKASASGFLGGFTAVMANYLRHLIR